MLGGCRARRMMRRRTVVMLAAALAAAPCVLAEPELPVRASCARAVLLDRPIFRHLHTELPARQPLLVSDRHLVAKEIELDLPFAVRIVKSDDPQRAQAFEFISAVAAEDDTVVVTFKFPPEG